MRFSLCFLVIKALNSKHEKKTKNKEIVHSPLFFFFSKSSKVYSRIKELPPRPVLSLYFIVYCHGNALSYRRFPPPLFVLYEPITQKWQTCCESALTSAASLHQLPSGTFLILTVAAVVEHCLCCYPFRIQIKTLTIKSTPDE